MSHEHGPGHMPMDFGFGTAGEEITVRRGVPLAEGETRASREAIVEALRTVHDPEIPVNIYDLGLIYECEQLSDGAVRIEMSLTAPACPVAGELPVWVADAVAAVPGTGEVEVSLVWDPPWRPDMMSDDAKLALGFE